MMYVEFRKHPSTFFGRFIVGYCGLFRWLRSWKLARRFRPYSHVRFRFSDGQCWEAMEGIGTHFFDEPFDVTKFDIRSIPCTEEEEARVRLFCASEQHNADGSRVQYDRLGVVLSQLPLPLSIQSETKWFCSEAVVAGLQVIMLLTGYTPARVAPWELWPILEDEIPMWKRLKAIATPVFTP